MAYLVSTVTRALVNIPKSQLVGTGTATRKGLSTDNTARNSVEPVRQPPYETEAAMTSAIASGTYNSSRLGTASQMYVWIAKWVRYQKYLAWMAAGAPRKKGQGKTTESWKPGYRSPNFTIR